MCGRVKILGPRPGGAGGMFSSFISQVEHGQASPSISSLERLVQALGMTLGDFFRANTPPAVVRSHERTALTHAWSRAQIEALAPGRGRGAQPLFHWSGRADDSRPYYGGTEVACSARGRAADHRDETVRRRVMPRRSQARVLTAGERRTGTGAHRRGPRPRALNIDS